MCGVVIVACWSLGLPTPPPPPIAPSIHHGEELSTGAHVAVKVMDKDRLELNRLMECVSREVSNPPLASSAPCAHSARAA